MKPSIIALASLAIACGSSKPAALPRFDNDYAGARVAALASGVPIAVEIWAPW